MKNLDKIPVDGTNSKVLIGYNYLDFEGSPKESFTRDEKKAGLSLSMLWEYKKNKRTLK